MSTHFSEVVPGAGGTGTARRHFGHSKSCPPCSRPVLTGVPHNTQKKRISLMALGLRETKIDLP